jgi:hypothetical protein
MTFMVCSRPTLARLHVPGLALLGPDARPDLRDPVRTRSSYSLCVADQPVDAEPARTNNRCVVDSGVGHRAGISPISAWSFQSLPGAPLTRADARHERHRGRQPTGATTGRPSGAALRRHSRPPWRFTTFRGRVAAMFDPLCGSEVRSAVAPFSPRNHRTSRRLEPPSPSPEVLAAVPACSYEDWPPRIVRQATTVIATQVPEPSTSRRSSHRNAGPGTVDQPAVDARSPWRGHGWARRWSTIECWCVTMVPTLRVRDRRFLRLRSATVIRYGDDQGSSGGSFAARFMTGRLRLPRRGFYQ